MKRIIIIGEGQTEQFFCRKILSPYLATKEIYVENPVIKKTHGGIVNWEALRNQVVSHLKQDKQAYVTTLIDYYGIYQHHQFPNWVDAEKLQNKNEALDLLEAAMLNSIPDNLKHRFKPYIQLHEFEGLIFSDRNVFERYYEPSEANIQALQQVCDEFANPEMINKTPENAPSKRLERNIKRYYKIEDGIALLEKIDFAIIRAKCPRFDSWIAKLESI